MIPSKEVVRSSAANVCIEAIKRHNDVVMQHSLTPVLCRLSTGSALLVAPPVRQTILQRHAQQHP